MKLLLHFFTTVIIFVAIDLAWLGFIGKPFYHKIMSHLMRENVVWPAAILFYLLFNVGLFIFVINPAMQADSMSHAVIYGALFGFFNYMTYELTNMAVIDQWKWSIVPLDIAWGTFLVAGVAAISFYLSKFIYA